MSVAADLFTAILSGADVLWSFIRPYKEAIMGLCVVGGGGWATWVGAYRRQARRPEEALSEAATRTRAVSVTMTQLHGDDRDLMRQLHDVGVDLARSMRHLTGAVEDNSELLRRAGRRRPPDEGDGGLAT